MKRLLIIAVLLTLLSGSGLRAQGSGNNTIDVILNGYTARKMTQVPVTGDQLNLILKCGMKAPSARNTQPWKFTVVKDNDLQKKIIADMLPGNVLIIVSGAETQ